MVLSFIVPASRTTFLFDCISSILNQQIEDEFEIICVLNGSASSDFSADIVRQLNEESSLEFINSSAQNAAQARNEGAKKAKGTYLAFIDDDVIIPPIWAKELLNSMSTHFQVGISSIIPAGKRSLLQSVREKARHLSSNGTGIANLRKIDSYAPTINSSAFIIQTELFTSINGFDESLGRCEDFEFSLRLFSKGGNIFCTNKFNAKVYFEYTLLNYIKRSYIDGKTYFSRGKLGDYNFAFRFSDFATFSLVFFLFHSLPALAGFLVGKLFLNQSKLKIYPDPTRNYVKNLTIGLERNSQKYFLSPFTRITMTIIDGKRTTYLKNNWDQDSYELDLISDFAKLSDDEIDEMLNKKYLTSL